MELRLTDTAKEDIRFFLKSGQVNVVKKIELLSSIQHPPFTGIGKPEPLKYHLAGKWSRRIDNDVINIYSVKGHYK